MKSEKDLLKYLGLLAIILSILGPIAVMAGIPLDGIIWVVAVIGLIIGFFLTANVKLMLAGIVLLSITGIFATIPTFGILLNDIFRNLAVFTGALISIPALKIIWSKFKVKL